MENTTTKSEVMMPIFLKAGIPLAIAVSGFIFSRLTQRTHPITSDHLEVHEEEGTESLSILESSDSSTEKEGICHDSLGPSLQNSGAKINTYETESSKIRVQELEADMKHQELMLLELYNKLSNDIARVELAEREISSLEAEMTRLENIGLDEYIKIVKLLVISGSENGLLRKRVKKLLKKSKHQSHLIKEQSLRIETKDTEIQRKHEQLVLEGNVRRNMEDEIEELKTIVAELQMEKNELLNQIDFASKTVSSIKIEEEEAMKAGYDRVVNEREQLVKERDVEAKELIYLRWCNSCLRHELMRRKQEQFLRLNYGGEISDIRSVDEIDYSSISEHEHAHHPISKRVKIVQKLKRWMERHQ